MSGTALVPSDGGPFALVRDLSAPELADEDHHHLAKARRLRPGDPLILGDGAGTWVRATFQGRHPELAGEAQRAQRPAPELTVAFALVKGQKPELVVQKLTELGIDTITPFVAARSVVRWDQAKSDAARARLEKVAREAAMQSRRAWLPTIGEVSTYAEVARLPGASRADRGGDPPRLTNPTILVGPEGGWSEGERALDLTTVSLADGVLRAETAAITAGALLSALRAQLVTSTQLGRTQRGAGEGSR